MFLTHRLRPLRSSLKDTKLEFYPQELNLNEVIQVIVIFVARRLLALIGLGTQFQFPDTASPYAGDVSIPELHLSMPFRVSNTDLLEYAVAVGASEETSQAILCDPKQACLLLSAFSEPAFLLLLAHHRCPVQPLGSVNVRNRFELHRPDLCTAEALLDQSRYELKARLSPAARTVRRGIEIDFVVDVVQVKEECVVFRQVFTMLQFMKLRGKPVSMGKKDDAAQFEGSWDNEVKFKLTEQLTMTWARICKDYNPIHISSIAAKAFGFPGRLMHGNHAFAAGLHALQIQRSEAASLVFKERRSWTMEVQFRRPIAIPCDVDVQGKETNSRVQLFKVSRGERACITGLFQELDNRGN